MMKLFVSVAALALAAPLAAQVESVPLPPSAVADDRPEAALGRDIGRAAGAMAVAAQRAAVDAKAAARAAKREFRRGFGEGVTGESVPRADFATLPPIRYEDEAVDACAAAAEDEGSGIARLATVRDILFVDPSRYGWDIEGTIDLRDSYRERRRAPLRFTCVVRDGGIADVRIGDSLARR